MDILIALTYYRPHYSGLTTYVEREARALVARGHRVTILTSRYDPNLPAYEVRDGIEIIRPRVWFRLSKAAIMPSILYWAWKLARQADVIHLHVPQLDAAPIAAIGRLMGKPIVLTYHCDLHLPPGIINSIANAVSNLANHVTARAANVIVQSTGDYAENSAFMKRYLDKFKPIYPPIEVKSITGAERRAFREKYDIHPDQLIIGMAARLATEKGVEYLAGALPEVLKAHPKARVLFVGPNQDVVGEDAYAQRLAPIIDQLGDRWSFLGVISSAEMTAFFERCDVTILPSINSTESYGLVQVESIACGTSVIASDMPGIRIPVLKTGTGILVPSRNTSGLAQAIIDILDHPDAYRGNPKQLLERSAPKVVAAEYEIAFEFAISRQVLRYAENPSAITNLDEI